MHDTISLESLQKVCRKEGEVPPHIALRTNIHVNDPNKEKVDDKYPWLDVDNK